MSIESAKEFAERAKWDTDFRQAVLTSKDKFQIVKDAGFDFTQEEWHQVRDELKKERESNKELSEEELKNVAGGVSCYCFEISCYCFEV